MRTVFVIMLAVLSGQAAAQQSDDDALALADSIAESPTTASAWHAQLEAGIVRANRPAMTGQTLSFDFLLDHAIAPSLRMVLADRIDIRRDSLAAGVNTVNTLKEAYGSYAYGKDRIVDIGRINVRSGVALGYNPTDFFKVQSIRVMSETDPESLRSNRLGSVMLRGQVLSEHGSLTLMYSPKLASIPDGSPFDIDLGATNGVDRWLLAFSPQLGGTASSTLLLYNEKGKPPTLGLNQTWVVGGATVAYLEATRGKSAALAEQALGRPGKPSAHTKLAVGLRFTTQRKQAISLEYDYSTAALSRNGWQALRTGAPGDYLRYRQLAQSAQELPTRQAWFAQANWQDAGVDHLDLNFILRRDIADRSRLYWLEGRYHFSRTDLIVQAQHNAGDARSTFGALPHSNIWTVKLLTYF